jgi:hypothetical protein
MNAAFILPDDFDGNAQDALRLVADFGDEQDVEDFGSAFDFTHIGKELEFSSEKEEEIGMIRPLDSNSIKTITNMQDLIYRIITDCALKGHRLVASFYMTDGDEERG